MFITGFNERLKIWAEDTDNSTGVDFTKGFKTWYKHGKHGITWYKFSTEIRFMLIPIIVLFIAHGFISGKF